MDCLNYLRLRLHIGGGIESLFCTRREVFMSYCCEREEVVVVEEEEEEEETMRMILHREECRHPRHPRRTVSSSASLWPTGKL